MAAVPAFFGLFLLAVVTGQVVDITPQQAVRRVGEDLIVTCKVNYQAEACRMIVGQTSYLLRPGNQDGDVIYHGPGLDKGVCGMHIRRVKEEWNGNISCMIPPPRGSIELQATMRLIVAHAPELPVLIGPQQTTFHEGDRFEAQCVVARGRPAATIKWFLDDEALLGSELHEPSTEGESTSDLVTVRQNVTRVLRADDSGRRLTCRSEHEALEQYREASRQLQVHYPPKRVDADGNQLTIFGLKIGDQGRLNVTVRSNPPPSVEWTVGDQVLVAPNQNGDGTITAMPPVPLGNGFYNLTLILARVAKEDVERTYFLRAVNDLGREEVAVRISTMDEPAGVELDTGAIVGIVVGVLALLVAVFLVVFAKATDRWCFAAGRGRDHAKASGESTPAGDVLLTSLAARPSDTESAAGGGARERQGRLAALGARVRGVLPKARDKVQATEAQGAEGDEKPLSEEKKGVVYAELALGEQPAAKPPPPSTEYAEIVYTEQPPKENKE
ncbi:fasciclin-3 isoform X2 [Hyposmocoma kahamanoa]|uniref:fasciclin-3 isoform X2 n=1 Tax=Hyposmocoma kahamanoa TaxID=1477025 RepID=UPI000E6D7170|nr:fasciclin-3 isoform X2 [Hyposmocoma kahamanoa]